MNGNNIRTLHRNLLLPLEVKLEPDYESGDSILEEDSDDEEGGFVNPIVTLSPKGQKEDVRSHKSMYNLNPQILICNLLLKGHLSHYTEVKNSTLSPNQTDIVSMQSIEDSINEFIPMDIPCHPNIFCPTWMTPPWRRTLKSPL